MISTHIYMKSFTGLQCTGAPTGSTGAPTGSRRDGRHSENVKRVRDRARKQERDGKKDFFKTLSVLQINRFPSTVLDTGADP